MDGRVNLWQILTEVEIEQVSKGRKREEKMEKIYGGEKEGKQGRK